MANEITLSVNVNLTRTEELVNWMSGELNLNQTGSRFVSHIQAVTTTAAAIQLGAIGTLGYTMVRNMDTYTANEMYLLTTTGGVQFARLSAGEIAVFKMGPDVTAPAIKMLSTAAHAEILILEL